MANRVIIFAGQSNAGSDINMAAVDPQYSHLTTPQPGVRFIYNDLGDVNVGQTAFIDLQPLLENSLGGSELTLGEGLPSGDTWHIIKAWENGTSLHTDWGPGDSTRTAFETFVDDSLALITDPIVEYMVWVQGEGDANLEANAIAYERRLQQFIADLRKKYGMFTFLYNEAHPSLSRNYRDELRDSQQRVLAATEYTYLIDLSDQNLGADLVHFDGDELLVAGERFAAVIAQTNLDADFRRIPMTSRIIGNGVINPGATLFSTLLATYDPDHYWRMDAASGSFANSGSETNTLAPGTVNTYQTTGALLTEPSSDSANVDALTAGAALLPSGDFSMGGWFNVASSGSNQRVLSQQDGTNRCNVFISSANGSITALIDTSNNASTTTGLDDSAWHFWTLTRSGNVWSLYVDGVSEITPPTVAWTPPVANTEIGQISGAQDVNGHIDEVFILDGTVLTLAQHTDLYTAAGYTV